MQPERVARHLTAMVAELRGERRQPNPGATAASEDELGVDSRIL
jgi:hypothetical protein